MFYFIVAVCLQDEKEQLLQYRSSVAGLVGRAKNIVQLKPRNPESPVRSSIPVKAICDYRQIEVLSVTPSQHFVGLLYTKPVPCLPDYYL